MAKPGRPKNEFKGELNKPLKWAGPPRNEDGSLNLELWGGDKKSAALPMQRAQQYIDEQIQAKLPALARHYGIADDQDWAINLASRLAMVARLPGFQIKNGQRKLKWDLSECMRLVARVERLKLDHPDLKEWSICDILARPGGPYSPKMQKGKNSLPEKPGAAIYDRLREIRATWQRLLEMSLPSAPTTIASKAAYEIEMRLFISQWDY